MGKPNIQNYMSGSMKRFPGSMQCIRLGVKHLWTTRNTPKCSLSTNKKRKFMNDCANLLRALAKLEYLLMPGKNWTPTGRRLQLRFVIGSGFLTLVFLAILDKLENG